MIVRDSSLTLPACLSGIRPYADELIVVDTGSVDDTREIALKFDASLYEFPWIDDFSAARNVSLERATAEWIFWMDSDDTIDAANGAKLRALVESSHRPEVLGYVAQVHIPGATPECSVTSVDHIKLVRNDPRIRFEGRIHEQLIPSIGRLGGKVEWTDIFVVHSGSDQSVEGRRRKCERDLRILEKDLEDRPGNSFVLFNLGMTYTDLGESSLAIDWLQRSREAAHPSESHVRKIYALLVHNLELCRRFDEAITVCRDGRELFPEDTELAFREGMLRHQRRELDAAVSAYRSALQTTPGRYFSSFDTGIRGYKTRNNLALVYQDLGRDDLAEIEWRRIVRDHPAYAPGWRMLTENLVRRGKLESVEVLRNQMPSTSSLCATKHYVEGVLAMAKGDKDAAQRAIDTLQAQFEDELTLVQQKARFHFTFQEWNEAIVALNRLLVLEPTNPAVLRNLSVCLERTGDPVNAARALDAAKKLQAATTALIPQQRL